MRVFRVDDVTAVKCVYISNVFSCFFHKKRRKKNDENSVISKIIHVLGDHVMFAKNVNNTDLKIAKNFIVSCSTSKSCYCCRRFRSPVFLPDILM